MLFVNSRREWLQSNRQLVHPTGFCRLTNEYDYLAFCAERNEEPEKPFSGSFTVRVTPELHRAIAVQSKLAHQSLNSWVSEALEQRLAKQHVVGM